MSFLKKVRSGFGLLIGTVFLLVPIHGTEQESSGFPASGISLLGWVDLPEFPGNQTRGNDLWGYVSPSGREYAIVGLSHGTAFVEVTDPKNPVVVGYVDGQNSIWRDMKVYQNICYTVSESGGGLQIIDLSEIDEGVVIHVGTSNLLTRAHNIALNPESGFAYPVLGDLTCGIAALDLSNPVDPQIAGTWGGGCCHDAQVVTYTEGPYAGREIAFCFAEGDGLIIVDVTDKSNMTTLSSLAYPGVTYCHQGWLSEDRRYVFIDDELDSPPTTTYIIDVQDLEDPQFVTSFTNGLNSIDHNLMVRGDFVYEANYSSGLRVYDASDINNVFEAGFFDTFPENNDENFMGAWAPYTQLPSEVVLVNDRERGLFILDVSEITCGKTVPRILHALGLPEETRPFSGYIDSRAESSNGIDLDLGLDRVTMVFSEPVFDVDCTEPCDLSPLAFTVTETGAGTPPTVVEVNTGDFITVEIVLNRPITLQEWTTIVAEVQNDCGIPIESLGDLGPGIDEPDRVDVGFLPCDVNQDGVVQPFDLLRFRQIVNDVFHNPQGMDEDFVDMNRDGNIRPFDLLTFRQLINGVSPPATQPWAGAMMNGLRP